MKISKIVKNISLVIVVVIFEIFIFLAGGFWNAHLNPPVMYSRDRFTGPKVGSKEWLDHIKSLERLYQKTALTSPRNSLDYKLARIHLDYLKQMEEYGQELSKYEADTAEYKDIQNKIQSAVVSMEEKVSEAKHSR